MTVADIGQDTHRLAETLKFAASYRAHVCDPRFTNTTDVSCPNKTRNTRLTINVIFYNRE